MRRGVPIIESAAGGRAATRAAIVGANKNKSLVGARNLSVETYAEEVRRAYRELKKKRREQSRK